MHDRYVVLGLAQARAQWFDRLSQWSTSGAITAEFVKAISLDEVRVRLESGRAYSALVVDAEVSGVDRDLIAAATAAQCVVFVVDGRADTTRWPTIGAAAVLSPAFEAEDLMADLVQLAPTIDAAHDAPGLVAPITPSTGHRSSVVAVTGTGGTGASTVAIALAQGLRAHAHTAGELLLADLSLNADHAVLHDAGDVIPGVSELVDAHRTGTPLADAIHAMTFDVPDRHYRLLLGLRRQRDWTALRSRSVRAGLDGLRSTFGLVVADIDADIEGEPQTGSADVEDRNVLARSTIEVADVVVVVGGPGLAGVHRLVRTMGSLVEAGVRADRIVPLVNRMPRKGSARREVTAAITGLVPHTLRTTVSASFVTERRGIDDHHRDVSRLPQRFVESIVTPVATRLANVETTAAFDEAEPTPIEPGSLGAWGEELAG